MAGKTWKCCLSLVPDTTKFSYEPGKTYEYAYESDLKTWVNGASEDHSSLHIRATAQIEVLSRCEMVLKVGRCCTKKTGLAEMRVE